MISCLACISWVPPIRGAQLKMGRGHAINPAAIFHQIDRMGVGAIAVVVLMSFIVGAIVAQQGAFQLRYFGAEILVVDLVAILVLRELGVLMTAIMVAGRTGSAITAEIGSMKMREEVDALTVIGLNPVGVLVFPRLVALVVALPCLTVIANFAAIGGAMVVAWSYSGIPPETFLDRMRESIGLNTIFVGLIKAPFMALIIGIIASVEGMKVGGSAESLGQQVTSSVGQGDLHRRHPGWHVRDVLRGDQLLEAGHEHNRGHRRAGRKDPGGGAHPVADPILSARGVTVAFGSKRHSRKPRPRRLIPARYSVSSAPRALANPCSCVRCWA